MKQFFLSGWLAQKIADWAKLPYSSSILWTLEFNTRPNFSIYLAYDAGFDYQIEGHTYEREWQLWPKKKIL